MTPDDIRQTMREIQANISRLPIDKEDRDQLWEKARDKMWIWLAATGDVDFFDHGVAV